MLSSPEGSRPRATRRRRAPGITFALSLCVLPRLATAEVLHPHEAPRVAFEVSTILFGSCLSADRPHPIFDAIVSDDPDLFVFTGDNVYADTNDRQVMSRRYDTLAESPRFQILAGRAPIIATWDDHDYGKNDAGREYSMRKSSEAQFEKFWGLGPESEAANRDGVYQSYLFGPEERRVQVILLDTRFFRSALKRGRSLDSLGPYAVNDSLDATILGSAQWSWFEEELTRPAKFRVVVSSIQVLPEAHGWESWANFPFERQRFIQSVSDRNGGVVVILSGDRHFAEISALQLDGGARILEVTSSGLNRQFPAPVPNRNEHRVGGYFLDHNYGALRIDWTGAVPSVFVSVADREGTIVIETKIEMSDTAESVSR